MNRKQNDMFTALEKVFRERVSEILGPTLGPGERVSLTIGIQILPLAGESARRRKGTELRRNIRPATTEEIETVRKRLQHSWIGNILEAFVRRGNEPMPGSEIALLRPKRQWVPPLASINAAITAQGFRSLAIRATSRMKSGLSEYWQDLKYRIFVVSQEGP